MNPINNHGQVINVEEFQTMANEAEADHTTPHHTTASDVVRHALRAYLHVA